MSVTTRVLLALVVGLVAGLLLDPYATTTPFAEIISISETVGTLWVNAIRMTVVPLVLSLLITGVSSAADPKIVRSVGTRAFAAFLGLLCLSAVIGLLIVPLLFTWLEIDSATSAALRESALRGAQEVGAAAQAVPSLSQFLVNLVPTNPVRAAADSAMLPLVIFALAFGLALLRVSADLRTPVLGFFRAVGDATLVIVRWIIAVAPLGVFALMLPMASRAGLETAGALTYYVVAMAVACLILTMSLYPVVAVVARISMARFARGVLPAQAVAVSTSSSLASLPALVEGATHRLRLPPSVAGVALPLAVSTFKISSPVVWTVAALFLARLYGVDVTVSDRLMIAATALLSSFSVPGIPHGWLLLVSPLLATVGVPVEGIALLFAVDVIPDIFATTANVTADLAAATIVARQPPPASTT
ncbi:MAG: dicarboxylate/amino acid:cation symporter [Gemmatimonadaceae bacterium]